MTECKQCQLTSTELARQAENFEVGAAHVKSANMSAKACVLPVPDRAYRSGGTGE
jgi:hypothetical protein